MLTYIIQTLFLLNTTSTFKDCLCNLPRISILLLENPIVTREGICLYINQQGRTYLTFIQINALFLKF